MSGAGGECEIRGDEQHQNGVAREGVGVGGVRGLIVDHRQGGRGPYRCVRGGNTARRGRTRADDVHDAPGDTPKIR